MKKIALILSVMVLLMACDDEATSTFSKKYRVRFYFETQQSSELYNAIGNPGQFVTIRPLNGKVRIENTLGGNDYALSQIGSRDFEYGLGGLIVGTSSTPNMQNNFEIVAYDLACPNCDRQSYRLKLKDDGSASCGHCGMTYDLNNFGWILNAAGNQDKDLRGLYRYRVVFNGMAVNITN